VVADRLRQFYDEGAGGPFLVFSAWPTPPPHSLGMAPVGHPPLMVRVPGAAVRPAPDGVEIVAVTSPDELAELESTLYDAYPDPEMVGAPPGALFAPSLLDGAWRFYLARVDGRTMATAASWRSEQVTTVEMVSCRPEARGRGIGAAITAAAATDGTDQPAALIASDLGQGVYRSLGFVPMLRYTLWLGRRAAER
jgi:GNAT superfamily N-acetyltransferase